MKTEYDWWTRAVAGEKIGGPTLPVYEGKPEVGFYRKRDGRNGPWLPVAIYWHGEKDENDEPEGDQKLVCLIGFNGSARAADAAEQWTWVAKNPVSYEMYKAAFENGRWPDDAPEVHPKADTTIAAEAPAPIGHNMPSDKAEALRAELAGEQEIVAEFLKAPVETQEQADKIGPWAKRIGEIGKSAEAAHKSEKQPHLDAGRAIDAKYKPIVEDAKTLVAKLKKHLEPFLIARKREEEERARKAREEAERLRREALEKAAASDATSADEAAQAEAERADLLRKAQAAEDAAKVKNASAGRTGAKVALRTVYVAVITDFDACYAALKDHPDMKVFVQQLADRACRAKVPLAGVEFREQQRAA